MRNFVNNVECVYFAGLRCTKEDEKVKVKQKKRERKNNSEDEIKKHFLHRDDKVSGAKI